MDFLIFSFFSIISFLLLALTAFKKNLFLGLVSGIIFIIMGTFLISEGIDITYSSTSTVNNTFTSFMGFGYWIIGLGDFVISMITSLSKKTTITDEEEEE